MSFRQLFSSYMYVEKRRSWVKFVHLMLMKLTPGASKNDAHFKSDLKIIILLCKSETLTHSLYVEEKSRSPFFLVNVLVFEINV